MRHDNCARSPLPPLLFRLCMWWTFCLLAGYEHRTMVYPVHATGSLDIHWHCLHFVRIYERQCNGLLDQQIYYKDLEPCAGLASSSRTQAKKINATQKWKRKNAHSHTNTQVTGNNNRRTADDEWNCRRATNHTNTYHSSRLTWPGMKNLMDMLAIWKILWLVQVARHLCECGSPNYGNRWRFNAQRVNKMCNRTTHVRPQPRKMHTEGKRLTFTCPTANGGQWVSMGKICAREKGELSAEWSWPKKKHSLTHKRRAKCAERSFLICDFCFCQIFPAKLPRLMHLLWACAGIWFEYCILHTMSNC